MDFGNNSISMSDFVIGLTNPSDDPRDNVGSLMVLEKKVYYAHTWNHVRIVKLKYEFSTRSLILSDDLWKSEIIPLSAIQIAYEVDNRQIEDLMYYRCQIVTQSQTYNIYIDNQLACTNLCNWLNTKCNLKKID